MNQVGTGNYFDGNFFYKLVTDLCLPMAYDIGKIILFACILQGAYMLMRSDIKGSVNKFKYAAFGYIILRFTSVFIVLIDTIAQQVTAGF
jgi:hypothetical protein